MHTYWAGLVIGNIIFVTAYLLQHEVEGGMHYLGRIWAVTIDACNAAELSRPGADPHAAPAFSMPHDAHEWAAWEPSDALLAAIDAIGSERVVSAAALPEARLTVTYLEYAIELLVELGMSVHALMPLALLRLIASRVLRSPSLERIAALRTAHLLHLQSAPGSLAGPARDDEARGSSQVCLARRGPLSQHT